MDATVACQLPSTPLPLDMQSLWTRSVSTWALRLNIMLGSSWKQEMAEWGRIDGDAKEWDERSI